MQATIKCKTGFLTHSKGVEAAKELQDGDPDWKYMVIDFNNGFGRIDVYDEDSELVETGFLPIQLKKYDFLIKS